MAGRKLRCGCGEVFAAPTGLAADEYDLVPSDDPPARGSGRSPGPPVLAYGQRTVQSPAATGVAPPAQDASMASSPKEAQVRPAVVPALNVSVTAIGGIRRPARAQSSDDEQEMDVEEGSPLKHRYLPVLLLVIGLVGRTVFAFTIAPQQPVPAMAMGISEIVLNVAVMLGGVWIAAALLGINFGPIGRVLLKLFAFAAVTTTVAAMVAMIDRDGGFRGPFMALSATFLLNCVFFGSFFDTDMQESTMTVVIVTILQAMAGFVLWRGMMAGTMLA
jgi:hypothetical protein